MDINYDEDDESFEIVEEIELDDNELPPDEGIIWQIFATIINTNNNKFLNSLDAVMFLISNYLLF